MSNPSEPISNPTTPGTTQNPSPDHVPTTVAPHHKLRLQTQLGALNLDIDLTLTAPWTVIYGPSGSGKSTILRAIAGLHPNAHLTRYDPQGNPQENPQNLTTFPPRSRQIAYAPQQPSLFPHLTVEQNVGFSQSINNNPITYRQNINIIFKLFNLEPLANRYPRNLSGGEQQRVNLARAFTVPNQQLMLLDEPFTGIGRALRDELLPTMRRWATEHNIPVLSVTHDVEEALQLHAEVVRLKEGRILAQGPAREVLSSERLSILNTIN